PSDHSSSSFLIRSTAFFQLTCCSTVRLSSASIAALGACCVFRSLEDVDVVVKPLQVLLLDGADPLEHLVGIEGGLRSGERAKALKSERSFLDRYQNFVEESDRI